MQITNIVKPTAQVGRVIELAEGDVYKRVESSTYDTKLVHGVITGILSNGERTTVTAIEYVPGGYSSNEVKTKIFTDTDDVAIYPADPTEFRNAIDDLETSQERAVLSSRTALERSEHLLEQIRGLRTLEVSAPTVQSVTA